jgi:hypothetical protein
VVTRKKLAPGIDAMEVERDDLVAVFLSDNGCDIYFDGWRR